MSHTTQYINTIDGSTNLAIKGGGSAGSGTVAIGNAATQSGGITIGHQNATGAVQVLSAGAVTLTGLTSAQVYSDGPATVRGDQATVLSTGPSLQLSPFGGNGGVVNIGSNGAGDNELTLHSSVASRNVVLRSDPAISSLTSNGSGFLINSTSGHVTVSATSGRVELRPNGGTGGQTFIGVNGSGNNTMRVFNDTTNQYLEIGMGSTGTYPGYVFCNGRDVALTANSVNTAAVLAGTARLEATAASADVVGPTVNITASPNTVNISGSNWVSFGLWTPVLAPSPTSMSVQVGRYDRHGRLVFIQFKITYSGLSGTADIAITGLPVTPANTANTECAIPLGVCDCFKIPNHSTVRAFVPPNDPRVLFFKAVESDGTAGSISVMKPADLDSSGTITGSGCYFAQ